MSPYCHQTGHSEPSGSTCGAAGMESAEPDTGTPTPTASSPSITPSPPPNQERHGESSSAEDDSEHAMAMNPPPVLQNGSPDCLPIDHNLPHLLRQVSGKENLVFVRDIKLRVISREMSLQRLALFVPNLRELNLDGSCLGSLRDLGCGLTSLHILRVSRCGLESLDGMFGLTSLRELHASNNMVDDIGPCTSLPHIRVIDLRKNAIQDISFVEFLNVCPYLEDLWLAECPAASEPGYRSIIRSLLPNLDRLDGIPLDQEQDNTEDNGGGNDDDNDDDDNDSPGSHPFQRRFRPSSRGDAFQYRAETPQNSRRLGGFGSGTRRNISRRSTSNEDIKESEEEKEVSSDNFQTSLASTDVDSIDCPSSAYHADVSKTLNHSTQSSSSESMLFQNNQESTSKGVIKKRPSTSVILTSTKLQTPQGPLRTSTPRKIRPSTATLTKVDDSDSTGTSVGDTRRDSPSALTSGVVVCGNLTTALRSRRKRFDAWVEEEITETSNNLKKMETNEPQDDHVTVITTDDGSGEGQEFRVEEPDAPSDDKDVLEESKKWRELYAAYRSQNKVRWEKEKEGTLSEAATSCTSEEEKLNKNTTEIKTEENKVAVRKKIQSTATPCCPHLFSRPKSTLETSYDADTSSNLESPKDEKASRKKEIQVAPKHW